LLSRYIVLLGWEVRMSRLSNEVKTHLDKARESALLAVETYNRPGASFRSGGFIVLMCIAWTALFHAIFFKRKMKPFYRKETNRRHFKLIEGDRKAWELATCVQQHFGANNPPERANIEFFVGLRNKIEHRSMPSLDISVFGECQALLFNFEDLLVREFGDSYALNESLSLALQFSCTRNERQGLAVKRLHKSLARNISLYVDRFRTSLSSEVLGDPRFSYKVFLIPKPANNERSADFAVEFVKFDPSKPEEMERYQRIVSLVKPTTAVVSNLGQAVSAGSGLPVSIRVVNNPDAPGCVTIEYDQSHPYRQKELLAVVNRRLPEGAKAINAHDVLAVRRVHHVESEANFYHKGVFGPSQYSDAFADWLVERYSKEADFFVKARVTYKEEY